MARKCQDPAQVLILNPSSRVRESVAVELCFVFWGYAVICAHCLNVSLSVCLRADNRTKPLLSNPVVLEVEGGALYSTVRYLWCPFGIARCNHRSRIMLSRQLCARTHPSVEAYTEECVVFGG